MEQARYIPPQPVPPSHASGADFVENPSLLEWDTAAFASLSDAVYIVDTTGCLIWANSAFERLTGYALAEIQGQPSTRYYIPGVQTPFRERRRLVAQGVAVPASLEAVFIHRNGQQIGVRLNVSNLYREGQLLGRLAIVQPLGEDIPVGSPPLFLLDPPVPSGRSSAPQEASRLLPLPWYKGALLCVLAVLLGAEVGHWLTLGPERFMLLWPVNGLVLAVLLHTMPSAWPGLVVTALFGSLVSDSLLHHRPPGISIGYAVGHSVETLTGALLLRRFGVLPLAFASVRAMLLTFCTALLIPVTGTCIRIGTTMLAYGSSWWPAWGLWWIADAIGILLATPLAYRALLLSRRGLHTMTPRRRWEVALMLLSMGVVAWAVFAGYFPFAYLTFPPLVWAALRFGISGAASAMAILAGIVCQATGLGTGMFAQPDFSLTQQGLFVQIFLGIMALFSLLLGAVVEQWRQAQRHLQQAREHLAEQVDERTRSLNTVIQELSHALVLQQQAEAAERLQRERWETTLASIGDAVIVTDKASQVTFLNDVAQRLLGWSREEALGQSLLRIFPIINEVTRQPVESPVNKVLREGAVIGLANHTLLRRRDGTEIVIDDSAAPIRDAHGTLQGVVLVFRDHTARRHTEAALRESEARFQMLANDAPVLIWVNDLKGCVFVNKPYLQYLGFSSLDAIRNSSWLPYVHPEDRHSYEEAYNIAKAAHAPFVAQFRFQRADGVYRWFQSRGTPRLLDNGTLLGYVGCSVDITEIKEAEAALQTFTSELERQVAERTAILQKEMLTRQRLEREAQRSEHFALLGRLAAGVAHELRNPLGVIFLYIDILAEECASLADTGHEGIHQAIQEIKTHLARVDDLMQDYLSLVRVSTIQRDVQDLGATVQSWATEFQKEGETRGMHLVLEDVATLGNVSFHASTLRRALLNLLQNAWDAMPAGGTVIVRGHSTATQVQLQVMDHGVGIASEQLSQIFEPLHTSKPGGTGLGLYIVQEILAAHEGQVSVESRVGQGTTFTLTLPRALPAAEISGETS